MIIKKLATLALIAFLGFFLSGCANGKFAKSKPFKHNTPLIKDDLRTTGQAEI